MRWSNIKFAWTIRCALLATFLTPCVGDAQEAAIASRQGFSGKQLFEHQWQWLGSPTRDVDVPVLGRGKPTAVKRRGVVGDGLGPLHNATSCAECHVKGGASGVTHNVTLITVDPRSAAIDELKVGGKHLLELFPGLLGPDGRSVFNAVVHDRSTRPGYAEIRERLADHVPGGLDDQWFQPEQRTSEAIARQPVIAGRLGTVDFYLSQRNSPALFGAGLIESINTDRIRYLAKRQAAKSSGRISGRFVGKFGRRGQVQSIAAFVSQACAGELGLNQRADALLPITSRQAAIERRRPAAVSVVSVSQPGDPADFKYANFGADMTSHEVSSLTAFIASIPRPTERPPAGYTASDVFKGEKLFGSVGCTACHVADLRPTSGMFSDLLLHDMGPRLQSPFPAPLGNLTAIRIVPPTFPVPGPFVSSPQQYYGSGSSSTPSGLPQPARLARPEQPRFPRGEVSELNAVSWDALQREWLTPPLWGVADTGPYLHDGRAETLEDAILWHGGESELSRVAYSDLSRSEKDLVVAFLSSLRAPVYPAAQAK
jgi:hypothetical protein